MATNEDELRNQMAQNAEDLVNLLGQAEMGNNRIKYVTGIQNKEPRNLVYFGAPGTGKSFKLNERKDKLLQGCSANYERITFHPDYTYANFVGTYKPVPDGDLITYKYVPGPFVRVLIKALENSKTESPRPFVLLIEEINRANVAAVFGDIFQLLDRGNDNASEYPIQTSEDLRTYLADELNVDLSEVEQIRIPDNMFIWATMNSADQGVFPMDTAFKRRWDFEYIGIDDEENGIKGKYVVLGKSPYNRRVEWNTLRKAINDWLSSKKINEDKLLGPYFISKKYIPSGEDFDANEFKKIFKSKVIMYLFEDAGKPKRGELFTKGIRYSEICNALDLWGVEIFNNEIYDHVPDVPTKQEEMNAE